MIDFLLYFKKINKERFSTVLLDNIFVSYLLLYLLLEFFEFFKNGFVSNFISMNIFRGIVLISGLAIIFKNSKLNHKQSQKTIKNTSNKTQVIGLGIAAFSAELIIVLVYKNISNSIFVFLTTILAITVIYIVFYLVKEKGE